VTTLRPKPVTIVINAQHRVSGLFLKPRGSTACLVLAHGAGAGMTHPFLVAIADDLAEVGVATLRFQFPYMEAGRKRPDPSALCHATVRAAVEKAHQLAPSLPLFAGGKSFGGRMTSQAQAELPLPGVRGLVFLGFPLHPAGRPAIDRADHLFNVKIPMLFLQGTRDTLAETRLLKPLARRLGKATTLKLYENADHSFHVPVRSGSTDEEVHAQVTETVGVWIDRMRETSRQAKYQASIEPSPGRRARGPH
jgi:predicted alpha/beta-hydrolase family hydrolase